jgi:hypothetical protein
LGGRRMSKMTLKKWLIYEEQYDIIHCSYEYGLIWLYSDNWIVDEYLQDFNPLAELEEV